MNDPPFEGCNFPRRWVDPGPILGHLGLSPTAGNSPGTPRGPAAHKSVQELRKYTTIPRSDAEAFPWGYIERLSGHASMGGLPVHGASRGWLYAPVNAWRNMNDHSRASRSPYRLTAPGDPPGGSPRGTLGKTQILNNSCFFQI